MQEKRSAVRTPLKCRIKISHESIDDLVVTTRDISDSGVFILTEAITSLPIGTRVQGQVQGMTVEAPVVTMEVVRTERNGLGLKFIP